MSYNKNLIITIISIISINQTIHSMVKRINTPLIKSLHPAAQSNQKKSWYPPVTKEMQKYPNYILQSLYKMYAPFQQPLYTNFIEPIYVGNKSHIWGNDMKERLNNLIMNPHDAFLNIQYKNWVASINDEQKLKYKKDILAYKQSYLSYRKNPSDIKNQLNLRKHMLHMNKIIRDTTPTLKEKVFTNITDAHQQMHKMIQNTKQNYFKKNKTPNTDFYSKP